MKSGRVIFRGVPADLADHAPADGAVLMPTLGALLAACRPDAPAVTDDTGTLDWAGLTACADGLAAQMHGLGVRPATGSRCGCRTARTTWR